MHNPNTRSGQSINSATRPAMPNQATNANDAFLELFPQRLRTATHDLFRDFAARGCPPGQLVARVIDFLENTARKSYLTNDRDDCRTAIRILRTHRREGEHYAVQVVMRRRAR